jgi:hypothetical protein
VGELFDEKKSKGRKSHDTISLSSITKIYDELRNISRFKPGIKFRRNVDK